MIKYILTRTSSFKGPANETANETGNKTLFKMAPKMAPKMIAAIVLVQTFFVLPRNYQNIEN